MPLTLRDLLQDEVYRAWFSKNPPLLPVQRHGRPWWIYLKMPQQPWQRAQTKQYRQAYKVVQKYLNKANDIVIVSRRRPYNPPTYWPRREDGTRNVQKAYWSNYPSDHAWCPYCRRPTTFVTVKNHHAVSASDLTFTPEPQARCRVCGIRKVSIEPWARLG